MSARSFMWAVLLVICACKQARKAVGADDFLDEPHHSEGEPIDAPAGAAWKRAFVTVDYRPGEHGVHASHSKQIDIRLHLDDRVTPIDERSSWETADDELARLARSHPQLRSAPDGHALAVSYGDEHWRLIVVGADFAFSCVHQDVDPDHLPAVRDVVLALLRDPKPHRQIGDDTSPRAESWGDLEVSGALRWSMAHADDADVRAAWLDYVLRGSDFPYPDSVTAPIVSWLGTVACPDDAMRATLARTIEDPDPARREPRAYAVKALSQCARPDVQQALTAALRAELAVTDASDDALWSLARVAWSLARVTTALGAAPPETRAALVALARDDRRDTGFGRVARLYAIRGLAALTPKDAVLDELAKLPAPERYGDPFVWPTEFVEWNEGYMGEQDLGIWARAALAR